MLVDKLLDCLGYIAEPACVGTVKMVGAPFIGGDVAARGRISINCWSSWAPLGTQAETLTIPALDFDGQCAAPMEAPTPQASPKSPPVSERAQDDMGRNDLRKQNFPPESSPGHTAR